MEIAASESILDLLRLISSSGILSLVLHLATACAFVHCIASHCAKCRTFIFQTENNKNILQVYTISQERLDGLALLAIENEAAKQLNTDDLLDSFANHKARQCKLMA